jgi:hypothetical protein
MKLSRNIFIFPFLASLLFLFIPLKTFAQTNHFNGQKIVILNKNQTINHDYFAAGGKITIDGTVNGDAYIAGGQVDINGIVNGDLLVVGGQINVRGSVSQNVRAFDGDIVISGQIGKNVTIAGGNLTIDRIARITGSTVIAGGNSEILAQINNLTAAGGHVRIENNILGNITAGVGTLEISPDTTIYGNLEYWSSNKTSTQGAKITGQTIFHQTQIQTDFKRSSEKAMKNVFGIGVFFTAVGFISSLILGILLIYLLPIYTQKVADVIRNKFWLSLLTGFIALIIAPIAFIILLTSFIGAPIAFALIPIYGILFYLAKLFAMLAIGKFVGEKAKWNLTPIRIFVIGILLYYIIGFIPVVGMLTKMVITFAGVGAIIIQKRNYYLMLREKKII